LDPSCDLSDDISTEAARVDFVRSAARLMMAKANLRLNLRKLYQADGYAVQELNKVAALLFRATSLTQVRSHSFPCKKAPLRWKAAQEISQFTVQNFAKTFFIFL
jgi:hypothetical protein